MALDLSTPAIQITIRAVNIGSVKTADATGHVEIPRAWYDSLKAGQPSKLDAEFAALGRVVFRSLEAIERAAMIRTPYKDGEPVR